MPDDLHDVDDLVSVPPESFVAARDGLAKRLKADGDAEAAAVVKRMRKPTVAQWVATMVRREHGDAVDELRSALASLAAAQEAALVDKDRDALRAATAKRRAALEALDDAIDDVYTRSRRPPQHRDEVRRALEDAAVAEVAPGTFGVRDDLELPEPRPAAPRRTRDPVAERRAAEARRALEAAEERVERARRTLEDAEAARDAARAASDALGT